jgi:pimeloyl-ACP methyl ester carboxylesterase
MMNRPRYARVVLTLILLLGLLALLIFGRGRTPEIGGAHAIATLEQIDLGGDRQWILVRGDDVRSPVVLFLHGGPGMPAMYLAHDFQRPLERDFVVVHWDRLGAGKSFRAGLAHDRFTLRRTLDDTHELAEHLRRRFGRERIYLVGHSWGTYLGMVAAAERPSLYAAYVGIAQMAGTQQAVTLWRRDWARRRATAAGNDSLLSRLEAGAPVTEDDLFRHGGELVGARSFWPILLAGLAAPEYTLTDVWNVRRGVVRVNGAMTGDELPLEERVAALQLPTFFFLGRHDANTPAALAAAYLERLDAPLKRVVWFDASAHFPFWEQPARFHEAMLEVHDLTEAFWQAESGRMSRPSMTRRSVSRR